jgi:hypothetical protein
MRIAIIDNINEDIGLKILFPEADYYICKEKIDKTLSYNYYNFRPLTNIENITDKNYDILFVFMPVRHVINDEPAVSDIRENYDTKIKKIMDNNSFKLLVFFDNEDYPHDPNLYIKNEKILFFKKNVDKLHSYLNNVIPFPFIMFGVKSMIERMDRDFISKELYLKKKNDVVFFSGGLYIHNDKDFNVYVNRIDIYNKISRTIYNPGYLNNEEFIKTIQNSKFSLDLTGAGNPNIRTFEILLSGSLLLQQKNNLIWPFEDKFSEECLFNDENDYFLKLENLRNDEDLYNKCLNNQYNITEKYFNKKWLRNYIEKIIFDYLHS